MSGPLGYRRKSPRGSPPPGTLTDQQRRVAELVAEGFTDREIGEVIRVRKSRVWIIVHQIADLWGLNTDRNVRVQIALRVRQSMSEALR